MKLLILAGGAGTRLWPLSRVNQPKQVQPFLDSVTLVQQTWRRLRRRFAARDIFVSATKANAGLIKKQLPELTSGNLIVEPVARNTAPAIALAAKIMAAASPEEAMAAVNSDHFIKQPDIFLRLLITADKLLLKHSSSIVMIGIKPAYAETGYGYIKLGRRLPFGGKTAVYQVDKFVEKPAPARAAQYVAAGNYLWNSGIFVFRPQEMLNLIIRTAPNLARGLKKIKPLLNKAGEWTVKQSAFLALPSISIDYAVMEKVKHCLVLKADIGWTDVGHWRAVYDILSPVPNSNVSRGNYVAVDSTGNLVYTSGKKIVSTIGLNNCVIIDTPQALLVCPRARAQDVKLLVEELKKKKLHKYL